MAITEIPTVATFGGPKESLRALAESAKRQSSANQNAVNEWLVNLATAVGEDDGSTAGSLREAVAAMAATTQTVTASPAVVSARFVVLDDDGHTAMSPGTLVMPPITPGAVHLIVTPYENVHYEIIKNPDDPLYTGPDYDVDSSFARQQVITLVAAVSEGVLRWQYDSTGYYINTMFVALTTLAARIDELEAPTPGDANAGTYSWTTAPELFVSEDSVEVDITLDGDTGEWPENTSRLVAIDNDGGFGFNLGVPSGHTLNGITNGNSGTLGDVARAANAAVFSVLVTRRGSTSWIWR